MFKLRGTLRPFWSKLNIPWVDLLNNASVWHCKGMLYSFLIYKFWVSFLSRRWEMTSLIRVVAFMVVVQSRQIKINLKCFKNVWRQDLWLNKCLILEKERSQWSHQIFFFNLSIGKVEFSLILLLQNCSSISNQILSCFTYYVWVFIPPPLHVGPLEYSLFAIISYLMLNLFSRIPCCAIFSMKSFLSFPAWDDDNSIHLATVVGNIFSGYTLWLVLY